MPSLRHDPRVEVLERTNIRTLEPVAVGGTPFDLLVADLSFISLVTVAPVLAGELAAPGRRHRGPGQAPVRGGPGRGEPGQGRDPLTRVCAARPSNKVASAFASQGATIMGAMASPLLGPAGNAEFLLYARAPTRPRTSRRHRRDTLTAVLDAAVESAPDAPRISDLDTPPAPEAR